jgi:hypothetical protein
VDGRPSPCVVSLALCDDALGVVLEGLRNTLDPRVLLTLSSACRELRALTQAIRRRLRADHEAATALCLKLGGSCKELRETRVLAWGNKGATADDLALLGTLSSVLPALVWLDLTEGSTAGPDGVQRLAEGLGAGALPAMTSLTIAQMHMGDAGASALGAALDRGALPRLQVLFLNYAASVTWGWWPSLRPCAGCPRWRLSVSPTTRSATRASPPSWRRLRRRMRCRHRQVC